MTMVLTLALTSSSSWTSPLRHNSCPHFHFFLLCTFATLINFCWWQKKNPKMSFSLNFLFRLIDESWLSDWNSSHAKTPDRWEIRPQSSRKQFLILLTFFLIFISLILYSFFYHGSISGRLKIIPCVDNNTDLKDVGRGGGYSTSLFYIYIYTFSSRFYPKQLTEDY